MSNLPIIIGGVALGYFLLNQKKTKTITIGTKPTTNKPSTNKPSDNKPDGIIRTDFPGYSIKDDQITVTNKDDAYQFAYNRGVADIEALHTDDDYKLNSFFENIFGLKISSKIQRPYSLPIVDKVIKIFTSNPDFVYNLWLQFAAGNIDTSGKQFIITQFLDFLQYKNIAIQYPIQLDLDQITKKDVVVFNQPYSVTYKNNETLKYIKFPGYTIQDELLTIQDEKVARNFAIMVGKYQPYSNLLKYLLGGSTLEYTDAYREPKYGDRVTLILKEKVNSDALWMLLSYLLAGAYSSDKTNDVMTAKYGNVLITLANFTNSHFGRDYPTFDSSLDKVKLYFEEVIKSMG